MLEKFTVENVVQAKAQVETLEMRGYSRDDIYIFAHSRERGHDITDALHTEEVGIEEQGFIDTMVNIFSSRGDELRSKMAAAGLTDEEAAHAESELDDGKLIIIAKREDKISL